MKRFYGLLATLVGGFTLLLATVGGGTAAATYPVRACRDAPGAANRSWTASLSSSGSIESRDSCGAAGPYDGLAIEDKLGGPPDATNADSGWWLLAAPTGASIKSLDYSRFLAAYSDAGWKPETRVQSATGPATTVLETCTFTGGQDRCSVGQVGGARTSTAIDAISVAIGGRCVPTGSNTVCERGASLHSLRSILYGATVHLADLQDPTIDGSATTSLAGGWRNAASGTVTVSATDNTGIRTRRVYVDGELEQVEEPTTPGGCQDLSGDAYTYLTPCAGHRGLNGSRLTLLTNTPAWGEGTHALRVGVVDTDGREARTAPMTVRLDFTAPPPPAPVSAGGSHWGNTTAGEVTWLVPSEVDRAPVTRAEIEVCASSRPCVVASAPGGAFGATLSHELASIPEGQTNVRIRHTDEAGNVGAWSPAAVLRRDYTPPDLTSIGFPNTTVSAGTLLSASASYQDPLSGLRGQEHEIQVGDGEWRQQFAPVIAEAGRTYRLRIRGLDMAGNGSGWQTSEPIVAIAPPSGPAPAPGSTAPSPPAPSPSSPSVGIGRAAPELRLRTAALDRSRRILTARGTTAPGATGVVQVRLDIRRGGRTVKRTATATIRDGRFAVRRRLSRGDARGRIKVSARYPGSPTHRPAVTARRSVLLLQ